MISMSELDGDGWIHDISYTYDDNDECDEPTDFRCALRNCYTRYIWRPWWDIKIFVGRMWRWLLQI